VCRGVLAKAPDCTPHGFRHTFATSLLEAGTDLRLVQSAFGHEDVKSTTLYTEVTQAALTAAMHRLPRGAIRAAMRRVSSVYASGNRHL